MSQLESEIPFLRVKFQDASEFSLPQDWEDVFVDYYGSNPDFYPSVAEKLRFVTGKYVENKAWPSKFDGLQFEVEEEETGKKIGDEKYDDPEFYWEKWEDWGVEGIEWGLPRRKLQNPPKWSDVAEAVMYQSMRGGLLQKALLRMGSQTRVVTPKQFIREMGNQSN